MKNISQLIQPDKGQPARRVHLVAAADHDGWLNTCPPRARAALAAHRFGAKAGQMAIMPGDGAEDWDVAIGLGSGGVDSYTLAGAAARLPHGHYRLAAGNPAAEPQKLLFGWLIGQYRFDRYRGAEPPPAEPVWLTHDVGAIAPALAEARAVMRVRDLVNTPAADMGPAGLEAVAAAIAAAHGGQLTVTSGDALASGYPLIHAVGRAAARHHAPRLIEIHWGRADAPRLAIIGKGVTFDSGGLNIKPTTGMALMKKDMGGAAHALALAELVMAAGLPVRLHCLIPAAENAISGDAFRPGDVLTSRGGLTVEITNTDAEGRLVLADALTAASAHQPDLMVDFATLTGAARVALGPDLPALFSGSPDLASAITAAGTAHDDPLWPLPLWPGYDDMLKSDIADMVNSAPGAFAGAVTAALFLARFVPDPDRWVHIDTFAWAASDRPGRPRGGAALGLRALWAMLQLRYPASTG